MPKSKEIHITYIGRLEQEKGIEILIECIKSAKNHNKNIVWHICGDGSYMSDLKCIQEDNVTVYGKLSRSELDSVLESTDLVIMPSLFLETFGLVALETLARGVPVCGFAQGGLAEFIHPALVLDRADPVSSFFSLLEMEEFPVLDISQFSYDLWIERLTELTEGVDKILLVSDYTTSIGGIEQYIADLSISLRSIGKTVEVYGYDGKLSRLTRIFLMYMAPFAWWRGISLSKKIKAYQPDLIWMHSVLRYIGPFGVAAISRAHGKKYMTHHDFGLMAPRPSRLYSEQDIPKNKTLGTWIPKELNIFKILLIASKWLTISWIWNSLNQTRVTHIIPSNWMQGYIKKYTKSPQILFPHTSKIKSHVK